MPLKPLVRFLASGDKLGLTLRKFSPLFLLREAEAGLSSALGGLVDVYLRLCELC